MEYLKDNFSFLEKNFSIWKAVQSQQLTQEELESLDANGIKSQILDPLPQWLKKWAGVVSTKIDFVE